jgi:hypothetical protein
VVGGWACTSVDEVAKHSSVSTRYWGVSRSTVKLSLLDLTRFSVTLVLSVLADIPIASTVATASDNGEHSEEGKRKLKLESGIQ